MKLILEALENVTSSCRWITGPTVAQMKLNVSLETRKFSIHHMFNALEWNKSILGPRKNPCMLHLWAVVVFGTEK